MSGLFSLVDSEAVWVCSYVPIFAKIKHWCYILFVNEFINGQNTFPIMYQDYLTDEEVMVTIFSNRITFKS